MKSAVIEQIAALKINELLIFVELSQVKSVREIARRRKVDPATISRTLVRIEKALDRKLFIRTADGVTPNETGRELIEKCRQLINFLEGISADSEAQEVVTFGALSFLNTRFLALHIDDLIRTTKSQVRLFDFPPDELIAAGLKGAFNIALHLGSLPWPAGTWASVALGEISWGLYCRKQHPLVNRTNLSVDEILKYSFVFPVYWGATEISFGNDQLPIPLFRRKKGVGTSTAETAYMTIQKSDLLAYLPSIIPREEVSVGNVKLLKTPWPDIKKTLYLTVKSDTITAAKFREIARVLTAQLR